MTEQMRQGSYEVPRSALLFMSAVEEARQTSEGPFRAIAPLFKIALEPQAGEIFNLTRAASRLQPILGSGFTQHALEAFLPALTKIGWLTERRIEQKSVFIVSNDLKPFSEEQAIDASQVRLDRLYEKFRTFLGDHAPLLEFSLVKEEFQWELFRWATSLDGSDKNAIRDEADKLLAGKKPSIRNAFLDEPQRLASIDKSISIEFAGFVKWLQNSQQPELDDVAALTELGLAYEFLDELTNPSLKETARLETVFILDAPVLLDWLGLSGPGREQSIKQSASILRNAGAQFATLPHCLEELSEVLETVLRKSPAERYGLTGDAMRADPALVGIARTIANNPDRAVKSINVTVIPFRRNEPINVSEFSNDLIEEFKMRATWHDPYKSDQRERDALSIAFVMRRRKGACSSDIFSNKYVLVARNNTFTRFAKSFCTKFLDVPEYALGPAIETKTLAATVWMRFGSEADPNLPRLHLISACDRILASNRMLLRKAFQKAEGAKGTDVALAM